MELKWSRAWGWAGWALPEKWILGGPGEEVEQLQLSRSWFKGQKAVNTRLRHFQNRLSLSWGGSFSPGKLNLLILS